MESIKKKKKSNPNFFFILNSLQKFLIKHWPGAADLVEKEAANI